MKDGYYWALYPNAEPEIVRVTNGNVEGFWNCESTLDELQTQGAQLVGPLNPPAYAGSTTC